ncbi:hypothetical protein [Streptomyces sp. NPDC001315]
MSYLGCAPSAAGRAHVAEPPMAQSRAPGGVAPTLVFKSKEFQS